MAGLGLRALAPLAVLCWPLAPGAVAVPDAAAACSDRGEVEVEDMQTQFVQLRRSRHNEDEGLPAPRKKEMVATRAARRPSWALPIPITWLHVPRTGSSFAFTLLQFDKVCDWGMALDFLGNLPQNLSMVREHCPGLAIPSYCYHKTSRYVRATEMAIGGAWNTDVHEGSVVGMFRHPTVRLLSDWGWAQEAGERHELSIHDFARLRAGCVTRMLTESNAMLPHCTDNRVPNWEQVTTAVSRVETGFAFVGMTDRWNVSMCLFNAMFNTPCHASQFPSYTNHSGDEDDEDKMFAVSALEDFVDRYDTPVWEAAKLKFESDMDHYDMSDEKCEPCTDVDDPEDPGSELVSSWNRLRDSW